MSYIGNITGETKENDNFRKVIFTGNKSQLVVMNIPVGGEVGEETHPHIEQTFFFLSGTAKVTLDGNERPVKAGEVVVVTPGTKHNVINAGEDALKVYTVYAPPNHIDGRVHATKEDADNDTEDEAFGQSVR